MNSLVDPEGKRLPIKLDGEPRRQQAGSRFCFCFFR